MSGPPLSSAPFIPAPPTPPNLADYLAFLRGEVGLATLVLADSSPLISTTLGLALDAVYRPLACLSPTLYVRAVYCLGADRLVNIAPDPPGCGTGFFAAARNRYGLDAVQTGLVTSSGDNGTSQSVTLPDYIKTLTLGDMQSLRTPWGREYLAIAMQLGPIWGLC